MGKLDSTLMDKVTRITVQEAAYIAGIFDGEGSVSIVSMKRGSRSPSFNVIIHVTNSCMEMLEYIKARVGGNVYYNSQWRYKGRGKVCCRWQMAGYQCKSVLEALQPYLIAKQEQAALAIEFLVLRNTWNTEKRFTMYRSMKELNGSGRLTGPREYAGEVISMPSS